MADTNFMQNWQIVQDGTLPVLGQTDRTDNQTIIGALDSTLDLPLRLFATLPADTKLNIAASVVGQGDTGSKSLPPSHNVLNSFVATTLDFQSGAVSGGTVTVEGGSFVLPDSTSGNYRRLVFSFVYDGTINCKFSAEESSQLSLPDPGTLLTSLGDTPIGYIDLKSSGTYSPGKYRSAAATSDIIENASIVRFALSGGGGGGSSESLHDAYTYGSTITTSSGLGSVTIAGTQSFKVTATGGIETKSLKLNGTSSGQISLVATDGVTSSYTLPADGTYGQALTTNGSGLLAWSTQNFVDLSTSQSIDGIKTFTSFPETPYSAPSTDYQVANKKYVNDQDSLKVNKAGDTMTGNLVMSGTEVIGLPLTPSVSSAAASKAYVDAVAQGLSVKAPVLVSSTSTDLNGITISGISTTATPTNNPIITTISSTTIRISIPTQPFSTGNLVDVDNIETVGGIPANDINGVRIITASSGSWIEVAADSAATTSASGGGLSGVLHGILVLTTSGSLAFDGLTVGTGIVAEDRILFKDMPGGYEQHNGLFNYYGKVSNDYYFERTRDADNSPNSEVSGGMFVFVDKGTVFADTGFVLSDPHGLVSLGVDAEQFSQFSAAGSIDAGDGLQKIGNIVSVKLDGDTLYASASGLKVVEVYLGPAPDGDYGLAGKNVPNVLQGDSVESATDKIIEIIDKLAPAKPPALSTKSLTIASTYSALESGTGDAKSNVIDSTTPTASTPSGAANGFSDGDTGTLSCKIDTVTSGSRVLTTGDDTGTYTALKITSDYDYYSGQAGKENFWKALIGGVQTTSPLSLGSHTYQLLHTITGNTAAYSFYVDDPGTSTISSYSITGSGTGRYISGVPSLATGDTITADFTVGNAIRQCYNSTRVAAASSSYTNSVNAALPSSPSAGSNFAASIGLTVAASAYTENASITCTGYNSKGTTATQAVTGSIRLDTLSNESSRKKSGTGQFPTKGSGAGQFGDAFVSTATLVGNDELQLLNASYQDPSHTNYSSNLPTAGPDYSSIGAGSWNSTRFVTLNLGAISSASAITVTINGSVNFGSSALVTGLSLYVLIDGDTGWLDANAAYPGVGNPVSDGDPALVVGSSTATSKRITFGTVTRTGDVWVRLGLPDSSTKKLTGFTLS